MRRRYFSILGLAGLLTLATSELTPDVFAQGMIKDVDACGFVVDQSGRPIAEATISASSGANVVASATSLSDGSFSFVQNLSSEVQLEVRAQGFVRAIGIVEKMSGGSMKKCKRPLYAVLAVGNGNSYLTTKKKSLPKTK
jgi:hypothetical protein